MRNFFILIFAGFFGGVAIRSFFPASPSQGGHFGPELALLFIFLGGILGFLFLRLSSSNFIFFSAVFLASFGLGILRYEIQDIRPVLTPGEITLSGIITDDPQKLDKFARAVFKTKEGAKILLTLPHYPEVSYGDKLTVAGKLRESQNFSDFDWRSYLAKDYIYFEMFLPKIVSLEKGKGFFLKRLLFSIKHRYLDNLSQVLPEPHSAFLAGLTVGERARLPESLEENFRKIGVIHIIVLSGYNISIISDSVLKVINYLPFGKIFRTLLATLGVILFALLTGASATVVRAAIMGILLLWARETGKIYQALTALVFAAFLMVLVNPKILRFDASFQLSFLATAGLIFLVPKIEKYFLWFPNFLKLREHLLATVSTQIFVLPLLLSLGGTFSWVTIPANLAVLIAVPAAMFFGFLSGLAGFISYYLSWLFGLPAYWLLAYELWIVKIFSGF